MTIAAFVNLLVGHNTGRLLKKAISTACSLSPFGYAQGMLVSPRGGED